MSRSDADIETIEYKLKKRGFLREPRPIVCDGCGERAMFVYAIKQTRLGGRTIDWCHSCHKERGWTRPAGEADRVVEDGFELEAFVE